MLQKYETYITLRIVRKASQRAIARLLHSNSFGAHSWRGKRTCEKNQDLLDNKLNKPAPRRKRYLTSYKKWFICQKRVVSNWISIFMLNMLWSQIIRMYEQSGLPATIKLKKNKKGCVMKLSNWRLITHNSCSQVRITASYSPIIKRIVL